MTQPRWRSWHRWRAVFTALLVFMFFAPWFSSCGVSDPPPDPPPPPQTFAGPAILVEAVFYGLLPIFPPLMPLFFPLAIGMVSLLLYILMSLITVTVARRDRHRPATIVPLVLAGLGLSSHAAVWFIFGGPYALLDDPPYILWGYWLTLLLIAASLVVEIMDLRQTRSMRSQAANTPLSAPPAVDR